MAGPARWFFTRSTLGRRTHESFHRESCIQSPSKGKSQLQSRFGIPNAMAFQHLASSAHTSRAEDKPHHEQDNRGVKEGKSVCGRVAEIRPRCGPGQFLALPASGVQAGKGLGSAQRSIGQTLPRRCLFEAVRSEESKSSPF